MGSLYYKNWVDLDKGKEKVYAEGYSTMWEADFNAHGVDKQDVINSKEICKYLIFPKVDLLMTPRQATTSARYRGSSDT